MEKGHQAKYAEYAKVEGGEEEEAEEMEGRRKKERCKAQPATHIFILLLFGSEKELKNRILCPFISHVNVQTHASYVGFLSSFSLSPPSNKYDIKEK